MRGVASRLYLTGSSFQAGGQLFRYLGLDMEPPALPSLTPAEREVVALLGEGLSNQAIAKRRGTSVNTVGNQIGTVFDKLGVASRFELAELVARQATAPARGPR
jgi:DNA-binding CsgD family transcriptional regulator